MEINNRKIGPNHPPYIIAEISANHNGSLKRALELIAEAKKTGADAVKLQTYRADTITLKSDSEDFQIRSGPWAGQSYYDLYEEAHTPWEWHEELFKKAKDIGITIFSAPFDETAVDLLEEIKAPAYKIASFECNHIPLIRRVAATGKPLIISTGMASLSEIELAVETAKNEGCKQIALLKCTSSYPAPPENSNLKTIPHMSSMFGCNVGLSDHTMGIGTSIAAIAFGACIIEKHFIFSRDDGGPDSHFSLEPQELKQLVTESKRAWESIGNISYGPTSEEIESLVFKRSLYISLDINSGDLLTKENLKCIRPGHGLEPKYYELVMGKRVNKDLKKGKALSWEDIL